jgi:hypothetical protein
MSQKHVEYVTKRTPDLASEQIERLKAIFPECVTEGQVDAEGNVLTSNPEASGRFHSDWPSMMYPRLFLARQCIVGRNGIPAYGKRR